MSKLPKHTKKRSILAPEMQGLNSLSNSPDRSINITNIKDIVPS